MNFKNTYSSNKNRKFYKIRIIALLLILNSPKLFAADAQQVFTEAAQLYQQGNYTGAIEKYEAILKSQVFSKELYYNLGNCYYRTQQIGKAVLNFERALQLAPTDADIQHNLRLAQKLVVDNIDPLPEVFILRWLKILRGGLSANSWSILMLIFLWAGVAGFIVWVIGKERLWKKRGFITGLISIPLSIALFFMANSAAAHRATNRFGIITLKETPFKTTPDTTSPPALLLHEGIKIEVLEQVLNQIKIRLPNSEEGWIESNSFEKI